MKNTIKTFENITLKHVRLVVVVIMKHMVVRWS